MSRLRGRRKGTAGILGQDPRLLRSSQESGPSSRDRHLSLVGIEAGNSGPSVSVGLHERIRPEKQKPFRRAPNVADGPTRTGFFPDPNGIEHLGHGKRPAVWRARVLWALVKELSRLQGRSIGERVTGSRAQLEGGMT